MKPKSHEICHDVNVSYVEAVVKNWEGFAHFLAYDVYKSKHITGRIVASVEFYKIWKIDHQIVICFKTIW
jgi:homospermidine synthase